ncbi:uncharacterized protein LOC134832748 [Culicoides brevitarsis]|uniref:uncharacterized protein LOC134832748 n=1 Tax=Culicoides brevitarsis TaxID=469753 RepID=UPI00307C6365
MPGTPPTFINYFSENQQNPPGIGFNPNLFPPNTPQEVLNPPIFPQTGGTPNQTGIYPTISGMPMPTMLGNDSSSAFISQEINSQEVLEENSSSSEPNISAVPSFKGLVGVQGFGGCWQHCTPEGPFPQNLVRAGVDSDGSKIFAGRAFHEGDLIPAKIIPEKNLAVISYGGEEIVKEDFEVLRQGEFVWEFCTNGAVPDGAVEIGQTVDGEKLYMGRAFYQGSQTPGKVQASHGCLYIPFNGEEVPLNEYEVLCIK